MEKNNPLIVALTGKIFTLITSEINKKETQILVREKIIIPLISLIYHEIYPYIIIIGSIIAMILLLTLATFIFFIYFFISDSKRTLS